MKRLSEIWLAMLVAAFLLPLASHAQDKSLTARVNSAVFDKNGQPVANASVATLDGKVQTTTDQQGRFAIEVPTNAWLLVSGEGFAPRSLPVSDAQEAVTLEPAFLQKEVNLPFTTTLERNTLGAINVLRPQEIAQMNSAQRLVDVLADRIPGLRGNNNIRGIGDALFVVDGVPRPADNINLEEVEEVTILKDAHAAVLYGPEARNGVILIKTKRGRANENRMNVFVERGLSQVRQLPEFLNSAGYMRLRNEALVNDGMEPQFSDDEIAAYASGSNPYRYPDVDYYSSEFINNTRNFNRVVSEFSGGNDNTRYYANVGWTNQGSLLAQGEGAEASNNRFNVRANVDFQITPFIKGYLDGVFVFNIEDSPLGNFWGEASTLHPYFYPPLYPVSLIEDEGLRNTARLINGQFVPGGTNQFQNTVYGNMFLGGSQQDVDRNVQFNNGIEIDLRNVARGLKFSTNLSFDLFNRYTQIQENDYAVYNIQWADDLNGQDSVASVNRIGEDLVSGTQEIDGSSRFFYRRMGLFSTLDFNRVYNEKHAINSTLVGYYNRYDFERGTMSDVQAHVGFRMAYTFNNRYLADFSGTLANSTRLPEGNRAGFSPSLALGWIISEENFMENAGFVNFLKLKASAGVIKTDRGIEDYYLYNSTFTRGAAVGWNDRAYFNPVVTISRAANPNLTFEEMRTVNIGLEGVLFNNALTLDANFFHTENSGQLVQRSVYPAYLGSFIPYENYEAETWTGADLGINYRQKISDDLSFNLGVNLLLQNSEITRRDEQFEYDYQFRQGRPNDLIFGLEALGFFTDSVDIASSPAQAFGEVQPGDIKYRDQNGDGVVDQNDAVEIGNWRPRVSYGIQLGVDFKNFSLFMLGGGQAGSDFTWNGDYFWVDGNDKYSTEVLNRWTPETAATATYPRLSAGQNNNNFRNSTFWLASANQFSLNHVQLTYRFPEAFMQKLRMQGASVYLRGQNLLWIGKDTDRREIRINSEPLLRHYALGLRLNF